MLQETIRDWGHYTCVVGDRGHDPHVVGVWTYPVGDTIQVWLETGDMLEEIVEDWSMSPPPPLLQNTFTTGCWDQLNAQEEPHYPTFSNDSYSGREHPLWFRGMRRCVLHFKLLLKRKFLMDISILGGALGTGSPLHPANSFEGGGGFSSRPLDTQFISREPTAEPSAQKSGYKANRGLGTNNPPTNT